MKTQNNKLEFFKKPEWIASILVVVWTFVISAIALDWPPEWCTPGNCENPLEVDYINQTISITNNPVEENQVATKNYVDTENSNQNLEKILNTWNDAGGTTITNLPTPTANTDVSTKAYVDASISAAGNSWGLPVYHIAATSASYDGNLGGITGANAKCQTEFGNTALMFNLLNLRCLKAGTCQLGSRSSDYGWYLNDYFQISDSTNYLEDFLQEYYNNGNSYNCRYFTSNYSGYTGTQYNLSTLARSNLGCNTKRQILCLYQE